ncbi:unnamed protein product, partial [Tetraodon nigroviridis]
VTSTQNNKADPSTPASKARVSPHHLHPDTRTSSYHHSPPHCSFYIHLQPRTC